MADEHADLACDGGSAALFTPIGSGASTFPPLPKYEPLRIIGRGAFSTVWLARERPPLVREVAIKVLEPGLAGPTALARFRREWAALMQAAGGGVTSLFDAGIAGDGCAYLVMERVEGESISTYCDRRSLPLSQRLTLAAQLAEVVARLHAKGIVHRDLKPSNVMVRTDGSQPAVVLLDFGLAALNGGAWWDPTGLREPLSTEGVPLGTPEWMAPEQTGLRSERPGTSADVWALGLVLERLWVGRSRWGVVPHDESTMRRVLTAVAAGHAGPALPPCEPPHWDDLSPQARRDLARLIQDATTVDPRHRTIDAGAMRLELERLASTERRAFAGLAMRRWGGRTIGRLALIGAGAVALVWIVSGRGGGSAGNPAAQPKAIWTTSVDRGAVIAWGENADGRCELPRGERYRSIACGVRWTLGVTVDGRVIAAGSIAEPACQVPDELARDGTVVTKVETRDDGAVALTHEGRVVQWGAVANHEYVSGLVGVRDIACGRQSLVLVESSGRVAVAAAEPGGMVLPPPVDSARNVFVGHKTACVVTETGKAYAWGSDASGIVKGVQGILVETVAIAGRDSQTTTMAALGTDGILQWFGLVDADATALSRGGSRVSAVTGARSASWFVVGLANGGVSFVGLVPSECRDLPANLVPTGTRPLRVDAVSAGQAHVAVIVGE